MFLSFEGIDGSGKSTQARLLADALRARGHDVLSVREPGGTLLGERAREILLDPEIDIDPRAELLLFSAARAQLVTKIIKPALAQGMIVIADRFFDSSTAYQGGGRGLFDTGWLDALNHFTTAGLFPTRTYLVDVDLGTAAARRESRRADRMEMEREPFYERVRDTYLQIGVSDRVLILDGSLSVETLHQIVLADALSQLH